MKRYYLRLKVKSPISISGHENRDGQTTPSLEYIPGSTLRGALAWHWLRRDPSLADDINFKRLLDEGLLRCGPLYPDRNELQLAPGLAQVLPATVRTCKHRPGFRTDPDKDEREQAHGVRDSLVALIEEEAMDRWQKQGLDTQEMALPGLRAFERCPHCGGGMDRHPGYYEWTDAGVAGRPNYWRVSPSKRMITRSAILPQLESTAPNNLFSREVLEEGQHLAGWLFVHEDMEGWMQATLGDGAGGGIVANGDTFAVGAARTAGLGKAEVIRCEVDQGIWDGCYGDLGNRMKRFNDRLTEPVRQGWCLVPITLLSDTILLDAQLRHVSALTADVLASYHHLEALLSGGWADPLPAGLDLFVAAARSRRVAGWNTAKGGKRPRRDDWAVTTGSVFVLAADPDQQKELVQICHWLEKNGIGERREDGYGQVIVGHPLHAMEDEV